MSSTDAVLAEPGHNSNNNDNNNRALHFPEPSHTRAHTLFHTPWPPGEEAREGAGGRGRRSGGE